MKKKYLYIMLVSLAATSLVSCDDLLDKEPLDRYINNPVYWSNESNVEAQCNSLYEEFVGYGNSTGSGTFYFSTLSDDQAGNDFANWTFTNIPASSGTWNSSYSVIRHVNQIISGVESSTLSDAEKNHYIGIGRLMRAYEHYKLVRAFGNVQWVDHVLDIDEGDILYGPRMDRDQVMDYVLDDLNFACSNIDESQSKIIFSRQMANAMKADICLYEGTFRKYRTAADNDKGPDLEGSKKYLNACVDACNYIMGCGYTLSDDYHAIYNSIDLSDNPEIIFYKKYVKDILMHSTIDYTSSSTQASGLTKDAFEAYLFTDGKPLATTTMDKTDCGVMDKDGKININNLLAVRDKRLSAQVDSVLFYNGNTWSRVFGGMEMTSSTGYGVCKYDNTTLPIGDRDQGNSNYTNSPLYWLSVIYLDYAEAKAELGSITQTELDNTINKLMTRAGLPGITTSPEADPANNMNVSNLIWEIRRCRRCELMFDGFRYWDLIRWHQLDKLDSSVHKDILLGANIELDKNATVDRDGVYINGSKGKVRTYEPKNYLYPIPSGQLTLNPALEQNTLWK